MPSPNKLVCKSAALAANAAQENYKLFIQSLNLIIRIKTLNRTTYDALMQQLVHKNMRYYYLRVRIKHLVIPANQTSIKFDNGFTGALPDLIIVNLVSDSDFANGNQINQFNFQNFGLYHIEIKRNGTPIPRGG